MRTRRKEGRQIGKAKTRKERERGKIREEKK